MVTIGLVVTPVPIVTVHLVSASNLAAPAVRVSVAVAVPEVAFVAANVVLPHPSMINGDGIVPSVKVGSTSAMLSVCSSGAFSSNEYDTDVSVYVAGRAIVRLLYVSTGSTTAVENSMLPAPMLPDADGSDAPAVRAARLAVCVTLLLVTPVATDTVHCSYAFRVAVAADRVSVASTAPDLVPAAVNVVVPHPLTVTSPLGMVPPKVNVGSTRVMVSLLCTRGVFRANMNEIGDRPDVTAFSTVKTVFSYAGVGGIRPEDRPI